MTDAQQVALGSCTVDEVAVRVATRIIGVYQQRNQFLIDAGFLATSHDGKLSNGSYCLFQDHPDLKLVSILFFFLLDLFQQQFSLFMCLCVSLLCVSS
jgi:D-serine deaminase-like pyridoxal phosphate-dependent protein